MLTHRADFKYKLKEFKKVVKQKEINAWGEDNLFWFGAVELRNSMGSGPWTYRIGSQKNLALLVFYLGDGNDYFKRIAPMGALFPFICRGKYIMVQTQSHCFFALLFGQRP